MLELRSGCRIHFGLMELRQGAQRCYAGLGLMLNQPQLRLRVQWDRGSLSKNQCATEFSTSTRLPDASIAEYQHRIDNWTQSLQLEFSEAARIRLEVLDAYPFHCGLGTGTQLAGLLTIARELIESHRLVPLTEPTIDSRLSSQWQSVADLFPQLDTLTLAQRSGRGQRSGIGLCGFLNGQLVLDSGLPELNVQPPTCRTSNFSISSDWRFVLIRCTDSSHISGRRELELMQQTARSHNRSSQHMWEVAVACCEAARQSDFKNFADRLEQYLELAAGLFAPVQGGKFNGPQGHHVAQVAVDCGLRAVGQSSWGPTIFGVAKDGQAAKEIAKIITANHSQWIVQVSAANTTGAQVRLLQLK